MNADPIEGEFFTPEGLADSLVRESIQNSLDARRNGEPVQVRLHFSGEGNALSSKTGNRYLSELWPHVQAIEGGRSNLPNEDEPVTFLVVEDFGTRGLCGSPEQDRDGEDPGGSEHKDFYYFWRNIGRSRKEDTQRGRWGLGKTVFPATSRVNSFFGYTTRYDDDRSLLMGQSVLKIHRVGDDRYCPYGFFARTGADDFQNPFDEDDVLGQFRKDFQLRRTNEPGLSIVIPFPDVDEIQPEHMVRSAIVHYFYPILRGELIVEVSADELHFRIDADHIDEIVESVSWKDSPYGADQLLHLFAFVRRTIGLHESELFVLPEPNPPRAPDWNVGRFDPDTIEAIKKQFAEKEMLAIRVPVTVRPKSGDDRETFFDVFVEEDPTMAKAEDHYIRQGITISKIATLREKGFRGLVVVSDEALSTLLGDSENPAHTEWLEKATRLKERFNWGPFTVRFVRNALQRIVGQLLHVPEGRDEQLLKNIFFLENDTDPGHEPTKKKPKKPGEPDPDPDGPPPPPAPARSVFNLQKIDGGFRITRKDAETLLPERISLEVAYEVRRGNAFKKYAKWDFDLGKKPIVVTPVGASCTAHKNTLSIEPTSDEFLVEVTGFDSNRDLAIRAVKAKTEVVDAETV
ncbi:MAG: hypothetical protein J5I93_09620 [Pirellulaceae bacterium]|nr:hypothetical protein [Pirellulaceae bacterium]